MMEREEEQSDADPKEERGPVESAEGKPPEASEANAEAEGPAEETAAPAVGEPAQEAPEVTAESEAPSEETAELAGEPAPEAPVEGKVPEMTAGAEVPVAARTRKQRRYVSTVGFAAAVFVLAAAFFVAGYTTRLVLDKDVDLNPIEDRLTALEDLTGDIDERTGEVHDILSGAVVNVDGDGGDEPTANPAAAVSSAADDDPTWGPDDASVVIVEFSDFQCPFCQRFATQTLPQIRDNYGDRVRYVFRDFPLSQIHPAAQKAAEAAQCAQEQGHFWEYHDLLFANQSALDATNLKSYAEQVGADAEEFNDCLESEKNQQEVLLDLQDGRDAGISGTPGFIVNGLLISGAQPYEQFQQVLDQLLAGEE
jgi:protein-disulfide isomerase